MASHHQIRRANIFIMPVNWGTSLSVSGPKSGRGLYDVVQVNTKHLSAGCPPSGVTYYKNYAPRSRGLFLPSIKSDDNAPSEKYPSTAKRLALAPPKHGGRKNR